MLEVSTNEYGPHNDRLVEQIQNGLNDTHRLRTLLNGHSIYDASLKSEQISNIITQKQSCCNGMDSKRRGGMYATTFWRQWYLLTIRMVRCLSRDRFLTVMRLAVTLFIALVIGGSYRNIGNDAGQVSFNFRFIYTTVLFFMHVPFVTMIFYFPTEMSVIAREHFNHWYSARAYYFALTFTDLPLQIACVFIYVGITYLMTAQPLELYRFIFVLVLTTLLALVSQSMGMIVGAAFNFKVVKN